MSGLKRRISDFFPSTPRQPKQPKASQVDPKKECDVCTEDFMLDQFPKLIHGDDDEPATDQDVLALGKAHSSRACFSCWEEHIEAYIDHGASTILECIECERELHETDIKGLVSEREYHRYLEKLTLAFIKQDPAYRECPSATCTYGYIMDKSDGNIFRCQLCSIRYCIDCEALMHEGRTCAQNKADKAIGDNKNKQEEATATYFSSKTKKCPGCDCPVRKAGGCDHMTCARCDVQFCWLCSAMYLGEKGIFKLGNAAHGAECAHHPDKLPKLHPEDIPSESESDMEGYDSEEDFSDEEGLVGQVDDESDDESADEDEVVVARTAEPVAPVPA